MIRFEKIQRHIRSHVHGARVVLESGKVHCVSRRYVQFRLLANRGSIERRFHIEVMTECHVVLRMAPLGDKRKHHCGYYIYMYAFKHIRITPLLYNYCGIWENYHCFTPFLPLKTFFSSFFLIFLEKSCQNIWRFRQNAIPLHSL